MKKTFYSLYLKRFIDFTLAFLALVILTPFLLVVIIFQIISSGFPIFFTQTRVGKDEKTFKLIKFRTMNENTDELGNLLPGFKRRTKFGIFLRRTSIDELPSLLNIIKGDMAIIGPRPLLVDYLVLYNNEQKKRHLVKPGLSGLAQIKGRNNLTWQQKFKYDIEYLDKVSLIFDIKIIFLTILSVISLKPVDSSSKDTMEKFKGNL